MKRNAVCKSNAIIKELMKIDPEFPMQWARCFMEIALDEGLNIHDLLDRTGISQSALSRIIGGLGEQRRYAKNPYGLIKAQPSPEDRRMRQLYLTVKGRTLIDGISDIAEQTGSNDDHPPAQQSA